MRRPPTTVTLGFTFWNWPSLRCDFVRQIGEQLGHRVESLGMPRYEDQAQVRVHKPRADHLARPVDLQTDFDRDVLDGGGDARDTDERNVLRAVDEIDGRGAVAGAAGGEPVEARWEVVGEVREGSGVTVDGEEYEAPEGHRHF